MDACILTLPRPGGQFACCALKNADMNSKLLDNFSYDPIEDLVKYFFEFLPRLFRKWSAININQEIFSIEKRKNVFFFIFTVKKPQTLFQNSMTIFLRIFLRYYTYL